MYGFDLKRFRKEKKLTQDELAEMLGYSRASLSNFESKRQPVTDRFLDKLNEKFGIAVEEFKSYNKPQEKVTEDGEDHPASYWRDKYHNLLERYNTCLEERDILSQKIIEQLLPMNKK